MVSLGLHNKLVNMVRYLLNRSMRREAITMTTDVTWTASRPRMAVCVRPSIRPRLPQLGHVFRKSMATAAAAVGFKPDNLDHRTT